ncbi:MAG: DNA-3-methyladenine glycosylase 2 family protein [Oscillospiraceae bacterium]|nr:DNA-3-methyladenine glycosylase 2 family protein [Oscillospiraceae bacterium]
MPEMLLNRTYLCSAAELDAKKTFECGQCFRWNAEEDGAYVGVAFGQAGRVVTEDNSVYIITDDGTDPDVWRGYFDLGTDYEAVRAGFAAGGDYLAMCAAFGAGIRILRQESWEALCSFIISQCNNIPRIKGIVDRLCRLFGDEICFDGQIFYTFPPAERLAALTPEDLAPLRCGYRAEYIISAARAVSCGEIDLEALKTCSAEAARGELLKLRGVGKKVADCTVLFGLGHMEAFPIDVWMKRALKQHFPKDFDPASLGEYAGLAQQYIFYYARSEGTGKA